MQRRIQKAMDKRWATRSHENGLNVDNLRGETLFGGDRRGPGGLGGGAKPPKGPNGIPSRKLANLEDLAGWAGC